MIAAPSPVAVGDILSRNEAGEAFKRQRVLRPSPAQLREKKREPIGSRR